MKKAALLFRVVLLFPLFTAIFLVAFSTVGNAAVGIVCFNDVFQRKIGEPRHETNVFPGVKGPATVKVYNGDGSGWLNRANFANVLINGKITFRSTDFNKRVNYLQATVNLLAGNNTIDVNLFGLPGVKIRVEVVQNLQSDAAKVIGPEGGSFQVNDINSTIYNLKINVPEKAVSSSILLNVSGKKTFIPETGGYEIIVKLEPDGLMFLKPINIEVPYDLNFLNENRTIAGALYGKNNKVDNLISELSKIEQLKISSVETSKILIELNHFSLMFIFETEDSYAVLNIPPQFLKIGDIIYALSAENYGNIGAGFDWFPGHTGMYLGEGYGCTGQNFGIDTIIESIPMVVRTSSFYDNFVNAPWHIYMGARRPDNVDDYRIEAAEFAINKCGYPWNFVGDDTSSDTFSCVGLVEAAYEFAGLNIISEILPIFPIQQFNRTTAVNEITGYVGEEINILVRGVINISESWIAVYSDDPSFSTIDVYDLPNRAEFKQNRFIWKPSCEDLGKSVKVKFEVKPNANFSSAKKVIQELTVRVNSKDNDSDGDGVGDACDGCLNDPLKIAPGVCGCGVSDIDNNGDGIPDCLGPDADHDGLQNAWEIANGLNPLVNDANLDADGDGYSNLEEYTAGTNPRDPNSHPGIVDLPTTITRVNVASDGTQANGYSGWASVNEDGRYIAFYSAANNLIEGGTSGYDSVYVRDVITGTTELASVVSDGTEANNHSNGTSISANGRFVAFWSSGTNLVQDDTNRNIPDVFVRDRLAGTTELVGIASDGTVANNGSELPVISADGRIVAFRSSSNNLVPGDTNNYYDIFVHDRQTGITERVSVASDGSQAINPSPYTGGHSHFVFSISADGRFVPFSSLCSTLVPSDTNNSYDIFVHDRQTGITERVNVASDDTEANGHSIYHWISGDGRYVSFYSTATNLVPNDTNGLADIFVHDRLTGTTERVSVASDGTEANGASFYNSISTDGRFVAFQSAASNLVPNDTNGHEDIFVHDRLTGATKRVSVAFDGSEPNNSSEYPSMSADGRFVAFESSATNLVPGGDVNGVYDDIFVVGNPLF